ncbi:hypothetical protein MNBD_GAMMA16-1928 [hydrothermal vent metagenome]|uniref:Uncharacterized protein n=1 Tax=hydrothermal vent metagenome TaxID=652676 RepID=A0A3B0ZSG0_9ZZZZ
MKVYKLSYEQFRINDSVFYRIDNRFYRRVTMGPSGFSITLLVQVRSIPV